jgi:predicted alpha/beta-hydrolase family hydrolase
VAGYAERAAEPFLDAGEPPVRGFLHRPAEPSGDAMVLAHGAGSDADAPVLVEIARAFSAAGFLVLRCDLPYRQQRRTGPPRAGDPEKDREGLRRATGAVRALGTKRVFLGGHSYGGRQASMLAAAAHDVTAGLLLLSYPLHPPRRPADQRTAHFPNLRARALFVHGTRDPFASIEELRGALALIPGRTRLVEIDGAGHDLIRGRAGVGLGPRVLEAFRGLPDE